MTQTISYTISEVNTITGFVSSVMSFETKKEANKTIKSLEKNGVIEKRGYDYFKVGDRTCEIRMNY